MFLKRRVLERAQETQLPTLRALWWLLWCVFTVQLTVMLRDGLSHAAAYRVGSVAVQRV